MSTDKDVVEILVNIPVNAGPISGMVASPDGSRLVVTNYGHNSVSSLDTDSGRVLETVAGVNEPFAIAMGQAEGIAYVSSVSRAYDSIEVIDLVANEVIATHPLALTVSDLAVSADGRYVYAGRHGARSADVAVLDTTTGRVEVIDITGASEAPGTTITCVRVSADGARLYVGTNGPAGGRLIVIGAQQPVRSAPEIIEIGLPIRDVALSPDGAADARAYVASCCPEFGAVVDVVDTRTNKITSTRKFGELSGILTGLTLSRDGERAYLVRDDGITVLCTRTQDVIGTIAVTDNPSCVLESPDGKRLYVADYSGTVTVVRVAPTAPLAIEGAAHRSYASADWVLPQLQNREPALTY